MPSALRSIAVLTFMSAIAVISVPGCSQQGEGERCDFAKNGDLDCDSGFTCVKLAELADHVTDRCCPEANTETDARCARSAPPIDEGSGGDTNGAGGVGSAAGGAKSSDALAGSPSVPASSDGGASSGGTPAASNAGTPATDASGGKGGD